MPPDRHVTYIKMMSCGAAPADMVPFERAKSPWGEAKDFFGVMQPNDLPGGGGRKLMEAVPIGLPEPHEFGGLLKAVGDEDGDREEEEALRGGRGAGDERWDAMARTALDEDLRCSPPSLRSSSLPVRSTAATLRVCRQGQAQGQSLLLPSSPSTACFIPAAPIH